MLAKGAHMVRKLVLSLLSLLILIPMTGWGLGLGGIHLHSALNQPLDADIELLSVRQADIDSLSVNLASNETFAKLGVDRPASLMFLKFSVEQAANGRYVIKVRTREAVKEPFLDFVVEVNWRSGRLLREYTLLLDPPEMVQQKAAPVTMAPVARGPAAPSVTTTPAAIPQTVTTPVIMPAAGELVYGPVKSDDTLWSIAKKLRPSNDISVHQMMMALYQANPEAFLDGNINRLRKGNILRIKDPSMITAMSRAEASREVMRHERNWQDYKQAAAQAAARRIPGKEPVGAAPAAASVEETRLELVTPEKGEKEITAATGAGEGDADTALQNELMLALESAEVKSRESEELRTRLSEVESQMAAMERLLGLKDDELAALQQQLREQGIEPEVVSTEPPAVEPVTETAAAIEEKPEVEAAAVPAPAAPKAAEPKPVAKPAVPAPSLMDDLLGNRMVTMGGGALVILLLLLGMIMMRRRRQEGSFQESILSGRVSSMLKGDESEAASSETSFLSDLAVSGMGVGAGDESEVDPMTEADVYIAYGRTQQAEELLKEAIEANPQRLELLVKLLELYHSTDNAGDFSSVVADKQSALQDNEALWNRVLVIGHELVPDDPLFSAGAEVVQSSEEPEVEEGKPSGGDILDIGLDLDALTEEMESSAEQEGGEFEIDLGLDLGDLEGLGEKTEAEQVTGEATEVTVEAPEDVPLKREEEFEIDFGGMVEEEVAEEAVATEEGMVEAAEEEETSLDFNLDFELPSEVAEKGEIVAEQVTKEVAEETGSLLDFDLGEFELPEEGKPVIETTEESESVDTLDMSDLDLGGLELADLEVEDSITESMEETAAPAAMEEESVAESDILSDLGDLDDFMSGQDEIGTKLDLARAYQEMGDEEGAREMLEEVLQDGSDEQKQQAEELMQKFS